MNRVAVVTVTRGRGHNSQAAELIDYAAGRGFVTVEVIHKDFTGKTDMESVDRAGTQRLLELAARRQISKVLIKEDLALGRSSAQALRTLEELHRLGVSLLMENGLETLNQDGEISNIGHLFVYILSEKISRPWEHVEKIKSGMQKARQAGKRIGRPAGTGYDRTSFLKKYAKVVKHLSRGQTVRRAAALCDISVTTVQKVKRILEAEH